MIIISLGHKGVPYQVTHPLVQSTYCHSLYYFPCHMRHETWAPLIESTIDDLKILNIPSEMFKLFNHSIFPHQGHSTRSMHPPWTYTTCIISMYFQHHQQFISISLSTSTLSHLNNIINNNNIIPYYIIINNNINSRWHDHH